MYQKPWYNLTDIHIPLLSVRCPLGLHKCVRTALYRVVVIFFLMVHYNDLKIKTKDNFLQVVVTIFVIKIKKLKIVWIIAPWSSFKINSGE